MSTNVVKRMMTALIALGLGAGCGGGATNPVPSGSTLAPLPDRVAAVSRVSVTPKVMSLAVTGSMTAVASESKYTGTIKEANTCRGVASVTPRRGKGPKFTATVKGIRAGSCTATFTDSAGRSAKLAVSVFQPQPLAGLYFTSSGSGINLPVAKLVASGAVDNIYTYTQNDVLGGVAADATGNVYFTVSFAGVLDEVAPNGTVTTIASGLNSPNGLAVDSGGNLYLAATGAVEVFTPGGTTPTQIGSGWSNPVGVAVDSTGNVYVSDSALGSVFKVAPGGAMTTLYHTAGVLGGIAVDSHGNVLTAVSVISKPAVVRIAPDGTTKNVGSGWGTPFDVAVDTTGNVYVSDTSLGDVVELPVKGVPFLLHLGQYGPGYISLDAARDRF